MPTFRVGHAFPCRKSAHGHLVDYRTAGPSLTGNEYLLTTRPPWLISLTHIGSGTTIRLFTWHAPVSEAGGSVFNAQAHDFFANLANALGACPRIS